MTALEAGPGAPPFDEAGNSVKAQKVIQYVANKLSINAFSPASVALNQKVAASPLDGG